MAISDVGAKFREQFGEPASDPEDHEADQEGHAHAERRGESEVRAVYPHGQGDPERGRDNSVRVSAAAGARTGRGALSESGAAQSADPEHRQETEPARREVPSLPDPHVVKAAVAQYTVFLRGVLDQPQGGQIETAPQEDRHRDLEPRFAPGLVLRAVAVLLRLRGQAGGRGLSPFG